MGYPFLCILQTTLTHIVVVMKICGVFFSAPAAFRPFENKQLFVLYVAAAQVLNSEALGKC